MVEFKDFLQFDIAATFINPKEFGEPAIINGDSVHVVIDNDLLKEQNLKNGGEGLAHNELLFHISKLDLPKKPIPNKVMTFNKIIYSISDVVDSPGLYTITLSRNRA